MTDLIVASSQLLPARNQMAFTLGFHIIFACLGIAFPAITLAAEYRARRHDDADAMKLAQRWSKVMAVTFAVGASPPSSWARSSEPLRPPHPGRWRRRRDKQLSATSRDGRWAPRPSPEPLRSEASSPCGPTPASSTTA